MYLVVLTLHSWLRWVAIVAGFGATMAALSEGRPGKNSRAERWGLVLMMALDVQLLVGLVLYLALSPIAAQARQNCVKKHTRHIDKRNVMPVLKSTGGATGN